MREYIVIVLIIVLVVFSIFNMFLLIGIASLLVKLVQYFNHDDVLDKRQWFNIIRARRASQMNETDPANYADITARTKVMTPVKNWDGVPKGKNWDGIPEAEK